MCMLGVLWRWIPCGTAASDAFLNLTTDVNKGLFRGCNHGGVTARPTITHLQSNGAEFETAWPQDGTLQWSACLAPAVGSCQARQPQAATFLPCCKHWQAARV